MTVKTLLDLVYDLNKGGAFDWLLYCGSERRRDGKEERPFYVKRLVPELYFWLKALTKGEGLCLCEFGVALWGWWGCFSLLLCGSEACWRTTGERKKGV